MAAAINFPSQNGKSRLFHMLGKDRFNGQLTYPMDLILKADPSISTGITSAWQGSIHPKKFDCFLNLKKEGKKFSPFLNSSNQNLTK